MLKEDLLKELKKEIDFVSGLSFGILKKYHKQIANGKQEKILGITKYKSPRNNNIWVVWQLDIYDKKRKSISDTVFVEYRNNQGEVNYIMPCYNMYNTMSDCVVITGHSIQRLKERTGMDWKGFLEYGYSKKFKFCYDSYVYQGKESQATAFGDKGLFMVVTDDKWGTTFKTFVSSDLLGTNQLETLVATEKESEDFRKTTDIYWKEKMQMVA